MASETHQGDQAEQCLINLKSKVCAVLDRRDMDSSVVARAKPRTAAVCHGAKYVQATAVEIHGIVTDTPAYFNR